MTHGSKILSEQLLKHLHNFYLPLEYAIILLYLLSLKCCIPTNIQAVGNPTVNLLILDIEGAELGTEYPTILARSAAFMTYMIGQWDT